jgi:hypothetical protein
LSSRTQIRRLTRITNGFSKKLENHRADATLWIAFYNLCRVHESLRCTPAMALGVTESHLNDCGACRGGTRALRRADAAASDARNDSQAGTQAVQARGDSGRKDNA